MIDKGIIFSDAMVRALLDGRKTQTRRLFKPRGFEFYNHPVSGDRYNQYRPYRDGTWDESRISGSGPMQSFGWGESLYAYLAYSPGDRLYIREAWHVRGRYSDVVEVGYRASENRSHTEYVEHVPVAKAVPVKGGWPEFPKYGPSIHMPRWASRMWLAVTDVRVQRLQEIGEEDAIAEGLVPYRMEGPPGLWVDTWHWLEGQDDECTFNTAGPAYRALWNSLHTKHGERWEDNPWICAVTFTVHHGNIDRASQ